MWQSQWKSSLGEVDKVHQLCVSGWGDPSINAESVYTKAAELQYCSCATVAAVVEAHPKSSKVYMLVHMCTYDYMVVYSDLSQVFVNILIPSDRPVRWN